MVIHKQNSFKIISKRGSRLNLKGFSLKILFHIRYLAFLNFFICTCKITCKPMGKFAEYLNLGKCVLPPWKSECFASICSSPPRSTVPGLWQLYGVASERSVHTTPQLCALRCRTAPYCTEIAMLLHCVVVWNLNLFNSKCGNAAVTCGRK